MPKIKLKANWNQRRKSKATVADIQVPLAFRHKWSKWTTVVTDSGVQMWNNTGLANVLSAHGMDVPSTPWPGHAPVPCSTGWPDRVLEPIEVFPVNRSHLSHRPSSKRFEHFDQLCARWRSVWAPTFIHTWFTMLTQSLGPGSIRSTTKFAPHMTTQ